MKISVIIPVYNLARHLRSCLDSVQTQTFTDWQAIWKERFQLKRYVVPSFILRRLGSFMGYRVLISPTRVARRLRGRI